MNGNRPPAGLFDAPLLAGLSNANSQSANDNNHIEKTPIQESPTKTANAEKTEATLEKYACVTCSQRKVKCNRQNPCSNCIKVNNDCVFKAPPPPKRRKRRKLSNDGAVEINDAETDGKPTDYVLAGIGTHGAKLRNGDESKVNGGKGYAHICARPPVDEMYCGINRFHGGTKSGKLVTINGKSRYLGNRLWASLTNELENEEEDLTPSDTSEDEEPAGFLQQSHGGEDLLLGSGASSNQFRHPLPSVIQKLWQVFSENFNPLCKLVHAPSLAKHLKLAAESPESLDRGHEALLFVIYLGAVHTLDDATCQSTFSERKSILLKKYRPAAITGLRNAHFLRTCNTITLQAFIIYLLASREYYDPRTFWAFTGIALRIAQRLGMHRDGETQGLSVYETEMRRRMWFQICVLDVRSGELIGTGRSFIHNMSDTKTPLNLNDADFGLDMIGPVTERKGATEMVFCLVRYSIGSFLRKIVRSGGFRMHPTKPDDDWNFSKDGFADIRADPGVASLQMKDDRIADLQNQMELDYLRHLDPCIPMHMLSNIMARSSLASLRFHAHHPRHHNADKPLPDSEKELLFNLAYKCVEYDANTWATSMMQPFHWHIANQFQWHTMVYLLSEGRTRAQKRVQEDRQASLQEKEDEDKLWRVTQTIYKFHPEFMDMARNSLHVAVGSLTLRAWDAAQAERKHFQSIIVDPEPEYIQKLRMLKKSNKTPKTDETDPTPTTRDEMVTPEGIKTLPDVDIGGAVQRADPVLFSYSNFLSDTSPIDWNQWDALIQAGDVGTVDFDADNMYR